MVADGGASVVMLGGIPAAYIALFGTSTCLGILSSHAPALSHKLHSRYHNWKYYWRRFNYDPKHPQACLSILAWLFTQQHQLKEKNCVSQVFTHKVGSEEFNYEFKIPKFNEKVRFITKYGHIYVTALSLNGLDLNGFELAVKKRPWFLRKHSRINFLDWFIAQRLAQFSISSSDDTSELEEPKIKYDPSKYSSVIPQLPIKYANALKKENKLPSTYKSTSNTLV